MGVSSPSVLQWIFPTQGLNRGLLHCRQILYQLSYQRSPYRKESYQKKWIYVYASLGLGVEEQRGDPLTEQTLDLALLRPPVPSQLSTCFLSTHHLL